MAFAGVDTTGGKSLGPRLLLPLLPLLCVSSLIVMASYLRSPSVVDRAVGWIGAVLVAAGVTIHLAGYDSSLQIPQRGRLCRHSRRAGLEGAHRRRRRSVHGAIAAADQRSQGRASCRYRCRRRRTRNAAVRTASQRGARVAERGVASATGAAASGAARGARADDAASVETMSGRSTRDR